MLIYNLLYFHIPPGVLGPFLYSYNEFVLKYRRSLKNESNSKEKQNIYPKPSFIYSFDTKQMGTLTKGGDNISKSNFFHFDILKSRYRCWC